MRIFLKQENGAMPQYSQGRIIKHSSLGNQEMYNRFPNNSKKVCSVGLKSSNKPIQNTQIRGIVKKVSLFKDNV
jgi:hypothetical protein